MVRYCIVVGLLMLCMTGSAQEWVEHEGLEYNCETIRKILEDHGDADFARIEGQIASLKDVFGVWFAPCFDSNGASEATGDRATPTSAAEAPRGSAIIVENSLYSFNNMDDGQRPVLGPIALPQGLYRIRVITDDAIRLAPTTVSGDCGFDFKIKSMNLKTGVASSGIQSIYEAKSDCEVVFEIELIEGDWTIYIETVDRELEPTIELAAELSTYSSAELDLQPIIGPIAIPAGTYTFTATTDGFFTVQSYALSENCGSDLEHHIFLLAPGEASDGADSLVEVETDCIALLDVISVDEDWIITIKRLS